MKSLIIIVSMLSLGFLFADVATHFVNKRSPDKQNLIGRKYYPILYKMKEQIVYPIHNKKRIKSYQKGSKGNQTTQMRSGYKVKR